MARVREAVDKTDGTGSTSSRGLRVALVGLGTALLIIYLIVIIFANSTTTVTEMSADAQPKVTTTVAPFSDSVSSVLLGAGSLLLLAGAFFSRVTKITAPGGVVIEFSSSEKKAAAEAVASKVNEKQPQPKVTEMAKSGLPANDTAAKDATAELAQTASSATLDALQSARVLISLAQSSPSSALDLADSWGISRAVSEPTISTGDTSPQLWSALADEALRKRQ